MSIEHLGEPLTGSYSIAGGEARLYERGATINGSGGEVVVTFNLPMIGVPQIAVGNPGAATPLDPGAITFWTGSWNLETLCQVIDSAFSERLALLPTGQPPNAVPITFGAPEVVIPAGAIPPTYGLPSTSPLEERQLYDVAVRGDDGQWRAIAPHAIYFRSSWNDFGIAHITDIHLARRIDDFPGRLAELGRSEAAQKMYNWNDRFRGFIRYANYLHSIGVLDVILATGDIIDYIFENNDDQNAGGNALFARELILGRWPSPTFEDVEELRVPIFMVAGNHDYRKYPYQLLFNLDIGPLNASQIQNYSGYNIRWRDGLALSRGDNSDEVPEKSADTAAKMVEVDNENKRFTTHLADRRSYVVQLGAHRIVMLDSSWDVGIVTDKVGGLLAWLGWAEEDERTFVGGSPNSEGVSERELNLVAHALQETPDGALVIVGLHAPLFNAWGNEYPYFLRETQRPTLGDHVVTHLLRHDTPLDAADIVGYTRSRHGSWFAAQGQGEPTYVKRGDNDDLFDYGVSRGETTELLRLIAGVGSRRPADVVLHGHEHRFNEFRIGSVDGELAYHLDFYTQNPTYYYPTRFVTDMSGTAGHRLQLKSDVTYVKVVDSAPANGEPTAMPHEAMYKYVVQVPPYPKPLATTPDVRGWWAEHRPLVLQSAALGPLENSQVSFSGFRLLSVKSDMIDKIHFVSTQRLHDSGYRLPWEDAIRPEAPGWYDSYWDQWTSVADGSAAPGSPVTAVELAGSPGRFAVFVADPNGGIYTTSGSVQDGWDQWTSVSEGSTAPGASVTAVELSGQPGRFAVFVADPNGGIYTTSGSAQDGWAPWSSVSEGSTAPGSPVTAVELSGDPGRFAVFVADSGGGVYTTSGSAQDGWTSWTSVSEGSTAPGASVTAVELSGQPGRFAVFVADPNGGIYTTSGSAR
jgi:predicted MPP superfamily phosphohydrolase